MVLVNSELVIRVCQLYVISSISVIFVLVDPLFLFTVDFFFFQCRNLLITESYFTGYEGL
jgi:hypothetical protein